MHNLNLKHNGQVYIIDMTAHTVENKSTGQVLSIEHLRDHGLIYAVGQCIERVESQRELRLFAEGMIQTLNQLKK